MAIAIALACFLATMASCCFLSLAASAVSAEAAVLLLLLEEDRLEDAVCWRSMAATRRIPRGQGVFWSVVYPASFSVRFKSIDHFVLTLLVMFECSISFIYKCCRSRERK